MCQTVFVYSRHSSFVSLLSSLRELGSVEELGSVSADLGRQWFVSLPTSMVSLRN